MDIVKNIKKLRVGKVVTNKALKDYTTYKVGGMPICVVSPENEKKLIILIKYLRENNIKFMILGNGSNVIFNSTPYDGVIVKLDEFNDLKINRNIITVGAGYMLNKLALKVSKMGFTGMEFACGIPGTVGGAVYMNAGAYKTDMGYITTKVKVLTPDYQIKYLTNREMNFHYRTSFLQKNKDYICLGAVITLIRGKTELIMDVINERRIRRIETQPLEYPSAGSVFRNPENDFAGRLIEELGFKGKSIGGAKISEKHANFIINSGNAKGEEIKELINEVKDKVKEKYNIELKVEQEFVE